MRDLGKYRGQRKDGKGWAYGYLNSPNRIMVWDNAVCMRSESYEVIPVSVGESTGLKDKSIQETEVYKGDLLESFHFPGLLEVDQIKEGPNCGQWIAKQEDGGYQDLFEALTVDKYIVVDNIHERETCQDAS